MEGCFNWILFVGIGNQAGKCRRRFYPLCSTRGYPLPIYFLPDFLMPCWPVLRGPFLPLAASCISFLALASEQIEIGQPQISRDGS